MENLRTSCRKTKKHPTCPNYSFAKGRCELGRVPLTCPLIKQKQHRAGSKAARDAAFVRSFYR